MTADHTDRVAAQWRRERPDLPTEPLLLLGRVERVQADADALLRPLFARAGLDDGAFGVLAALRRTGPPHALTPARLVAEMLVSGGAVTKRVDRLLAQGLVTRQRSTDDGRSRVVALTPSGRDLTDHLISEHLRREEELLSDLTDDQRAQLTELLAVLAGSLERRRAADAEPARASVAPGRADELEAETADPA